MTLLDKLDENGFVCYTTAERVKNLPVVEQIQPAKDAPEYYERYRWVSGNPNGRVKINNSLTREEVEHHLHMMSHLNKSLNMIKNG